jgi:hypothetical protein
LEKKNSRKTDYIIIKELLGKSLKLEMAGGMPSQGMLGRRTGRFQFKSTKAKF